MCICVWGCISVYVCNRVQVMTVWFLCTFMYVCEISIILWSNSYFFKQELDWWLTSLSYLIYSAHSSWIADTNLTTPCLFHGCYIWWQIFRFTQKIFLLSEPSLHHLTSFKIPLRYIFWKIESHLYIHAFWVYSSIYIGIFFSYLIIFNL